MSKLLKLRRASTKVEKPIDHVDSPNQDAESVASAPVSPGSSVFSRRLSSRMSSFSTVTTLHSPDVEKPDELATIAESMIKANEPFVRAAGATSSTFESKFDTAPRPMKISNSRLQAMVLELGTSLTHTVQRIALYNGPPRCASEADKNIAEDILNERRLSDPEYKAPKGISKMTKTKAKIAEFSYKEIQRAFEAAVDERAPLGLVDAFLGMGASADVSRRATTNLLKKMTKSDNEDVRSRVLQNAVSKSNVDMVKLVAGHADQRTLDESLLIASELQDLEKLEVLLAYNADYSRDQKGFCEHVRSGREDIVNLLLSAQKGPTEDCKALALVEAVKIKSLPKVVSLLSAGADASFDDAAAMRSAIAQHELPIALAIACAPKPPTSNQRDSILPMVFDRSINGAAKISLLEMCLISGVTGPHAPKVLQRAVVLDQLTIIRLLLQYHVSIDVDGGMALSQAIELGRKIIFEALLAAPTSDTTRGNALVSACGASISPLQFTSDLLRKGASPNHEGGKPMIVAIERSRLEILRILIPTANDKVALCNALNTALHIQTGQTRIDTLSIILPAKVNQADLDAGLILLANEADTDHDALRAMMTAGASPEANKGEAVKIIACNHDVLTLKLLAKNVEYPEITNSRAAAAIVQTTSWRDSSGLETLRWLLEHEADAFVTEEAVIDAAVNFDYQALSFLTDWVTDETVYCVAFADMVSKGTDETKYKSAWLQQLNFDVVELLLKQGAAGNVVNSALLIALEGYLSGSGDESIINCLLEHHADVNHEEGLAVKLPIKAGHVGLLAKICSFGPSKLSLSKALSWVLLCDHSPVTVVEMIDILVSGKEKADVDYMSEGLNPPIYLSLEQYPRDEMVIRRLLELGCNVDTYIRFNIFGEATVEAQVENFKIKGDFYQYKAQYSTAIIEMNKFCQMAIEWYDKAAALAHGNLRPSDPLYLATVQAMATLYIRFSSTPEAGIAIAREALDAAVLDSVPVSPEMDVLRSILDRAPGMNQMVLYSSKTNRDSDDMSCDCEECHASKMAVSVFQSGEVMDYIRLMALSDVENAPPEQLSEEARMEAEIVTPLLWACCQLDEQAVSASVVDMLIGYKADVNYMSDCSKSTALLLATRYKRTELVTLLSKQHPDASQKDKFGRSALWYAARNGDQQATKTILALHPRANDGSVHEAARTLNHQVLRQLLQAGHDANFISKQHDNLTPLGELALHCDSDGRTSDIEETIELLVRKGADPVKRCKSKSILYLAMDNPVAVPVTSAFVEGVMNQYMNHKVNVFKEDGFNYSPSMYIKKGYVASPQETQQRLLVLLKDHEDHPIYYADDHLKLQPNDACGMPELIAEAHQARERHREESQRQAEKAQREMEIKRAQHEQSVEQAEEQHRQRMQLRWNEYAQKETIMIGEARSQHQLTERRNQQAIEHRGRMARVKAFENRQALQHKQRMHRADDMAQRRKMVLNNQERQTREKVQYKIGTIKNRTERRALITSHVKNVDKISAAWSQARAKKMKQIGY